MSREGDGYIQQICTYLGSLPYDQTPVGRIFPVDTGIMGRAFDRKLIQRTRRYGDINLLRADLEKDLHDIGNATPVAEMPVSYLAIPLLGPGDEVVLVLYAECNVLNFFADDPRVTLLAAMCGGLCQLFDWLNEQQPFPTLRNYPLEIGKLSRSAPTVFARLQEDASLAPPRFSSVTSLNFDASPA